MTASNLNKFLRLLPVPFVIFLVIYPLWVYGDLPARIPVHFNFAGEPDGWESKGMVFVGPGIGIGMYLLLLFLSFGGVLENHSKVEPMQMPPGFVPVIRLYLLWTNFISVALFSATTYTSIQVAKHISNNLNNSAIPIYLAGILVPLPFLYFKYVKEIKASKNQLINKDS